MYLVIETKDRNKEYTCFIELTKDMVEIDIKNLFKHIKNHENIEVKKVYFSNTMLGNW